jgi:hypothetical protein
MDAYDVKITSQDLTPKQEIIQMYDESSFQEKTAITFEKFRVAAGDEYYDSFKEKSSQLDAEAAGVYGGRMGVCIGKMGVAMQKQLPVDSKEVQALVATEWEAMKMVYPDTTSKRIYLAIRDQLCYSPIAQAVPDAAPYCEYHSAAMEVFAQTNFVDE